MILPRLTVAHGVDATIARPLAMRIIHPSMTRSDVLRSVVAASLTATPARFMRYETVSLAGPRAVTYRLRGRGAAVVIRHGTTDVEELALAFVRSRYALPSPGLRPVNGESIRILELGARTGLRGLSLLLAIPGAELVSVEPDPMNLIILRRTIAANPSLRWREIAGAVGDGAYLRGAGYARRLPSELSAADRRRVASPVDAGPLVASADVVLTNLRGAEWTLLADPGLRTSAVRAMIVECHASGCPSPDVVATGGRLLAEAGFTRLMWRKGYGARQLVVAWR